MTKVSVIIPNYNCAVWLERAVESCLIQGEDYLKEIIIVDDHSSDNSCGILKILQTRYPGYVRVFQNPGKGGNLARNYGFSKSSGEYIQWLDADDVLLENKFKQQLTAFSSAPDTDIVYSDWSIHTYNSNLELLRKEEKKNKQYRDILLELLRNNWSPPHCYLLKRSIAVKLHELKAWNPETRVGQDREYYTKAAILGACFTYVPGHVCIYNRWSHTSVSKASDALKTYAVYQLCAEFRKLIDVQGHLSEEQISAYRNSINTEILRACFYNRALMIDRPIDFFGLEWKFFSGKLKLFMPFFYFWQHMRYMVSSRSTK